MTFSAEKRGNIVKWCPSFICSLLIDPTFIFLSWFSECCFIAMISFVCCQALFVLWLSALGINKCRRCTKTGIKLPKTHIYTFFMILFSSESYILGCKYSENLTSIWFVKRVKVSRLVENLLKLSRVLGTFCSHNLSLKCLWSLEREFEMSLDEKEFWHKCLPPFQIYFVEKWNPTVTLIHKDGKIVDYSAMILRHFTLQGIDDWSV